MSGLDRLALGIQRQRQLIALFAEVGMFRSEHAQSDVDRVADGLLGLLEATLLTQGLTEVEEIAGEIRTFLRRRDELHGLQDQLLCCDIVSIGASVLREQSEH